MAKVEHRVAKKYARALFELGEPSELETLETMLQDYAVVWADNLELQEVMANPSIAVAQKVEIIRDLAALHPENSEMFTNFLSVLVSGGRMPCIAAIGEIFSEMLAALKKQLALTVVSAFPLEAAEQEAIQKRAEEDYGSLVTISYEVDQELIGGLQVKAGDKLFDSSVKGSLQRIREELVQ